MLLTTCGISTADAASRSGVATTTVNIRSARLWRKYVGYWQVVRNHSH